MLFIELLDLRAPRTPWLRPRFLSEDFTEAPLSPTSRSPTRLDPRAPSFRPCVRYDAGALQVMTPEEDAYFNISERTQLADAIRESTVVRREMAALMQWSLDRIGPLSGVRRVEEWEERHVVMREMERDRAGGEGAYWEIGGGGEENTEAQSEIDLDSGYGSIQGADEEAGFAIRVVEPWEGSDPKEE
ncbi:uncharacterized protein LTHEOB_3770 [Neofusicoccum parvum]|uniref:Uncharacterized protein LTHEOB_3770 n=1 Tax=Neofusicoccum parvum TaxID=310453 RepID=A0ACB5SBI0_9PEZI|nr:uncharacterized protein LTHEOB_3770 [Neofusicoccum parvum]